MVGPLLRTEEGHRFILTIVDYGSRFPDAIPLKTTTSLPYVLFACRSIIHQSTGFSPFENIFGRYPRDPLDILKEEWVEPAECKESVVSFLRQTYDRLDESKDIAITMEKKGKKKMKKWYDKKARDKTFTVGDTCLVVLPSSTNWLLAKWTGPYTVEESCQAPRIKLLSLMVEKTSDFPRKHAIKVGISISRLSVERGRDKQC